MKNKKVKIYWEILEKKRLALLQNLKFLKKEGFYLAGGTALALQIKHRISFDFDFYKGSEFSSEKILIGLQKISKKVDLIQRAKDTLIVRVEGIEVSLFTYPYKLLKQLIETEYIDLASLEDIAAMKMVAIIQRGIQRDFIDLYFLVKYLGLAKVLQLTEKKYPPFNKYIGLQAITYFKDAETSLERKLNLLEPIPWGKIKDFIIKEAKKFKETA
jgi:hypothetical protein